MSDFSELWDNEVKALAQACVTEPKLVQLLGASNSYEPTEEEKSYLKEMSSKYRDIYGMYRISELIFKVEHSLADGREWQAELAISEVYSVLSRKSYFNDLFKGDETNEEWKTRKALRNGLEKLMAIA